VPGRLSAWIVIAEFELLPARLGDFLALARGFAGECLAREPGCRQFDVVVLEGTPSGVLFYEAYDDLAAFEAHGRAAHLAVFQAAFKGLVVGEHPLRKGRREGS
jgi:quinol monooxygenase YgiN